MRRNEQHWVQQCRELLLRNRERRLKAGEAHGCSGMCDRLCGCCPLLLVIRLPDHQPACLMFLLSYLVPILSVILVFRIVHVVAPLCLCKQLVPSAAGLLRPDEEGNWKELIEQEVRVALQKQRSVADDIDSLLKTTKWKAFKASWAQKRVRTPAGLPRGTMAAVAVWPASLQVPQRGLILVWQAAAYAVAAPPGSTLSPQLSLLGKN